MVAKFGARISKRMIICRMRTKATCSNSNRRPRADNKTQTKHFPFCFSCVCFGAILQISVVALRVPFQRRHFRRIKAFYITQQAVAQTNLSKIDKLSLNMLGPAKKPRLRAKAAESRHLFPLLPELLRTHGVLFGARSGHLKRSVDGLMEFYKTIANEPRQMSVGGLAHMQASILKCVNGWKAYRGHLVFKFHCFFHIGERSAALGNPRCYWTYADEEENRRLGMVAKSIHKGSTFYVNFLQRVLVDVC